MYKLGRTWPKLGWALGRELRPKMDYAEVYTLLSPWPHLGLTLSSPSFSFDLTLTLF